MLQCKTKNLYFKKKLGDLILFLRNGISNEQVDIYTDFPVTRIETIADGKIDYNRVGHVEKAPEDYRILQGDILVSNINSQKHIGKVAIKDDDKVLYHGMNLLLMRPNETIDSKFLFYVLNFNKQYFERIASPAVNQSSINQIDMQKMEFIIPKDKSKQEQIANILSTCDEVIEKTEETIKKYRQIKVGIMQDLFTRGLDENDKLRPTYSQAPDLYKYSKVLDRYIPKDWDIKTFNELIQKNVIDSIQDGNHGEKHPKTSDFVAAGVPFIMANNLTKDGHIDLKNCNFITYEQYKSLRIGFSTENDVLLTHKGTVGLTAIVPSGVKDIMLTPQVTYYRIKDYSKLDNQYLYTYFQSPMFQNILQGLSEQSTRAYIGITKQAELNCVYMDINEQRNIGKIVAKMNDKLKYEKDILSKYRQIKQGLMKRLLTPPADAEIVEE